MKQHRVLGADAEEVKAMYGQTVLSTLRPKLVFNLGCARDKACMLLADGNVYEFPRGSLPRLVVMPERAQGRITQLAAGESHFVALSNHLVWNVYTWGTSLTVPSGLLGRDVHGNESALVPGVVKDIPARVVRISCGSNFTLCGTATGDLWGFSPDDCYFGQQQRSAASTHGVVKVYWASNAEGSSSSTTHFSAVGRFGVAWRDKLTQSSPRISAQQPETSDFDEAWAQEVPPSDEWFTPRDSQQSLLVKHASLARERSSRLALETQSKIQEEASTKLEWGVLKSRVMKQEARTEEHARTMLPFSRTGEFHVPPPNNFHEDAVSDETAEEEEGRDRARSFGTSLAEDSFEHLRARKRKVHLSRLRDKQDEERQHERAMRSKDAEVCAVRLAESVALLTILMRDETQLDSQLIKLSKARKDYEIAARDWRIRALLLERSLLRLKRDKRAKGEGSALTGEYRVFPSSTWIGVDAVDASISNRPIVTSTVVLEASKLSSSSVAHVVWVRGRMDPDVGLRLNLIRLRVDSNIRPPLLTRIFLARKINVRDLLSRRNDNSFTSAGPGIVTGAKQHHRLYESTTTYDLQKHLSVELTQSGEDATFWMGFRIDYRSSEEEIRRWADSITAIRAQVDGDNEVAQRILEEVEEKGDFASDKLMEWDSLIVELIPC